MKIKGITKPQKPSRKPNPPTLGKSFPRTKIGKYHYVFSVSPIPVQKRKKLYYPVIALNIERETYAQAIDYISLESLFSEEKYEIERNKVNKRLKKKILKLQKGGK